jgi:COP9 signalosome complex subunit 6
LIDEAFLKKRLDAYKKMFPNLDCVGWYSTGSENFTDFPDQQKDMLLQKSIQRYCENPIYLIMNPNSQSAREKKTIPIFLYETNWVAKKFEHLDFQLAQSEDERIAVDNVAKAIDPTAKVSSVSTNLVSTLNAIKILRRKILFLVDIFENSKEVQSNPEYTRRLNQIFN